MDLKWLLVRRITLVALACFVAGSALALITTARDTQRQNETLVELAARQLDLQLIRIARSTDDRRRFPDWELVSSYSLQPGQCLEFRSKDALRNRSSCAGVQADLDPPQWFLEAYRALVGGHLTATRHLTYPGAEQDFVEAAFDPAATAGQAWATVAPLLGFSAVLVAALCLVTFLIVDRALLPAQDILAGLNRLARGDLSCRLPAFRVTELNRISQVFNSMSEEFAKATSERAELARRLVDMQEEERRHLARELHDEIAQKLAALNAMAACIRRSVQSEAPTLVGEAQDLERMASGLMASLRRTLIYLRPQEIDDLGLVQSLRTLVEQHNVSACGRTTYSIEAEGDIEQLRAETSAHVYRIVQEALTNAAKHANARTVKVVLTHHNPEPDLERIRLSVVDDGRGVSRAAKSSPMAGAGLIGMRERVAALSGKLVAAPLPSGGFGLEVEFPIARQGA